MAKTVLNLDEDLLAQKASEDARARRASALRDLLAAADADGFDYDRLEDLDR
jgi:hypothetical protein